MRKLILSAATLAILVSFGQFMSSCKPKHEAPAKPKLSFSESTMTVKESDGTLDVTIELDKPSNESITVTYELDGSAVDKVTAGSGAGYDYEITSTYLEAKIPKGQTTGTISIKLYSDFSFEDDEEIEISIKEADTENIEITRDDNIKITLTQEDGLGIFLLWGVGENEHYTDVDMDLFLWADDPLVLTPIGATTPSFQSPEFLFIPSTPLDDGTYGLSCNYYEGETDPMNFVVRFIPYIDGQEGTPVDKEGQYTVENVNPWDTSEVDPILVETFQKSGATFSNFSDITKPEAGSRMHSNGKIKATLKREVNPSQLDINTILQRFKIK